MNMLLAAGRHRLARPSDAWRRRGRRSLFVAAAMVATAIPLGVAATSASADPCGTGSNPIVCENSKPGSPSNNWYAPYAYGGIAGYTDQISYQAGDTVNFKVESPVSYHIEIYRLGWYGGDGARLMPTSPTATFTAKTQPSCLKDSGTGMVDCGNWSTTASWTVPSDAVSGVYIANLDQADSNGLMTIAFVVRSNTSHSDIVVQTSDQTWEAYNNWGGANLYDGNGPAPDGRDYAVSYNRPTPAVGDNGLFGSEFAMIRFLERNGYDVSYLSGIDVSTNGSLLLNHKVFLASGHDEYWNQQQFDNVTAARKAGVNLAFFSGNEVFWRTRLAASIDSTADPNRTVVCYKMTKMELSPPDGIADPSGQWTGTWMDPNGAGSGGNQPQNQLTGTLFMVNGYRSDAMTVPSAYSKLRIWRNTAVASLTGGQVTTFPTGVLGYEWDEDVANSARPPGAIDLSSTTLNITNGLLLQDYGNTYGNGTATHSLVMYRDPTSHALVFGSGTVQWSWGLDTFHVDDQLTANPPTDVDMQQATVNVLADMGAQPLTLMSGLVAASQTTDTTGPSATISSPSSGATVPAMSPVTISGTATDVGGGVVARVEVSTDGGTTWQPATIGADATTVNWSYSWTPTSLGSVTVQVRAEDDSANVGSVRNLPLTVGPQQCPCTIFLPSATPKQAVSGDPSAVTLGVKFRTTQNGYITGIRFYKSTANTGTHTGSLWNSSGTLLATGTFTNETASGWQQMNFSQPVPVRANTTYVAGYYAPNGNYSDDPSYFASQGAGLPPLQALQSGVDGSNGVYHYGSGGGFPNQSFNDTNYWVDVVLSTSGVSTTPPSVTNQTPAPNATGVPITTTVTAQFNEQIDPATLAFTLTDSSGHSVPSSASYDNTTATATLTPGGTLGLGAVYNVSVSAADPFGNTMSQPVTWSFTTSSTPPTPNCPCSLWNSSAPSSTVANDTNSVELGTRFESSVAGQVTGVRFYNGAGDTTVHTGTLWDSSGNQLATGTFPTATGPGWQTLTFATPVTIQPDTVYVVSYHTTDGNYSYTSGYFTSSHSAYPLTALADGTAGGNGLYSYSSATTFPTNSFGSSSYWADVIFTASGTGGGGATAALMITGQSGTPLLMKPAAVSPTATRPWGTSHTRLGPAPTKIKTIIGKRHLHNLKRRPIFNDE